jgi:hypothetical protein
MMAQPDSRQLNGVNVRHVRTCFQALDVTRGVPAVEDNEGRESS